VRYVEVGGVKVSAIGLGTWQFGSREWGYGRDYAEGEAAAIVRRALDLGVNLIDTAEIYGFGQSERIVGRALGDRRAEVFLATKLFPVVPVPPVVASRARGSARRLGTGRIDLYQVHWPNPLFPRGPLMSELGRLQRSGLITHVGVSNHSLDAWRDAEAKLGGPVLSNQVEYSLAHRQPERELLPWAQAHDRIVIAYSPLPRASCRGATTPATAPAASGPPTRSSSLTTCATRLTCWAPSATSPPATTPRRRRWRWPGSCAGRTSWSSPASAAWPSWRLTSPPPTSTSPRTTTFA